MTDTRVITSEKSVWALPLDEIWRYRELMRLLVRRHIVSRYTQMALGPLWAVLEPLLLLTMLTFVFGAVLRVDTGGYPYPVYAFAGLIPWWLFSKTVISVAGSLQENMGLISKIYFPRLILPVANTVRELFDGLVTLCLLIAFSWVFGFPPQLKTILLIPLMMIVSVGACGIGMWFASIAVRFRDFRPFLTVVLQAGLYLTPILYSAAMFPTQFQYLYKLNPMYWAVETSRWILLDQTLVIDFYFTISMLYF